MEEFNFVEISRNRSGEEWSKTASGVTEKMTQLFLKMDTYAAVFPKKN